MRQDRRDRVWGRGQRGRQEGAEETMRQDWGDRVWGQGQERMRTRGPEVHRRQDSSTCRTMGETEVRYFPCLFVGYQVIDSWSKEIYISFRLRASNKRVNNKPNSWGKITGTLVASTLLLLSTLRICFKSLTSA